MAFTKFFDGMSVLTPVRHPGVDMLSLPMLGGVSISSLCLLGVNTDIPVNILLIA